MPEIATLVVAAAEQETDSTRAKWLSLHAQVYHTLVEVGPGDTALEGLKGEKISSFMRRLLQIGTP